MSLGWPTLTVELTPEQLDWIISTSLNFFTKYHWEPNKYLVVSLKSYVPGIGMDLTDYHITSIQDIAFAKDRSFFGAGGDPFFGSYAYINGLGGGLPGFNTHTQSWIGGFTTWHNVNEFFDMAKRMTGSNPDWTYDRYTHILKLMPEPHHHQCYPICITCQVEAKLEDLYGNEFLHRICHAYSQILLGTIRSKFQNVPLLGGGQLDGEALKQQGYAELDQVREEILKTETPGQVCFIG